MAIIDMTDQYGNERQLEMVVEAIGRHGELGTHINLGHHFADGSTSANGAIDTSEDPMTVVRKLRSALDEIEKELTRNRFEPRP